MNGEIWLVRHGETAWSRDRRHTGRTDVPLTERGAVQAAAVRGSLAGHEFALVLTSPLSRAAATASLAGFPAAEPCPDLMEWDYGGYEGRLTVDIRAERPGWFLWTDGCPGGETAADVAARAGAVLARARDAGGDVLLFGHGHALRVLTASWLGLLPADGRLFMLEPATLGVLGWEREVAVIRRWNAPPS